MNPTDLHTHILTFRHADPWFFSQLYYFFFDIPMYRKEPNEETVMAMPIQVPTLAGTPVTVKVSDILTLIGKPDIINSFTASDSGTIGIDNIMGAGIVSFHDMFIYSASDTVNVPVPANVIANQSYTVMFSDGTSVPVVCAENGILIIPFNKGVEGLTYIIYGLQMDPSMFIGM